GAGSLQQTLRCIPQTSINGSPCVDSARGRERHDRAIAGVRDAEKAILPPRLSRLHFRVYGSNTSRSPSPTRLKASTDKSIATPGKIDSHGALSSTGAPSRIIFPQVGVGGETPRPIKLRLASMRMADAVNTLASTTVSPSKLGKMCRKTMRT